MRNFEFIVDFPNEDMGLDLDLTINDCEDMTEKESLTILKDLVKREKIERGGGFRSIGCVMIGVGNFFLEYSVCDGFTEEEDGDDDWRDVTNIIPM